MTNDVESRLRAAMKGATRSLAASPQLDGSVRKRAHARTRRAARFRAFAAAGVVAAVAGSVLAVARDDDGAQQVRTVTVPTTGAVPAPDVTTTVPATTTAPTTVTPTTVPAPEVPVVPPAPRRYVMLREERVVVVDDGRERAGPVGDGLRGARLALAPDGTTVYVETWTTDLLEDRTEIQEWSLSGVPRPTGRVVLPGGMFPAVSPDGRWLAYARLGEESHLLTVRDLRSSAERVWRFPADHELQQLTWAPDSRRLALSDLYGGASATVVFDTAQPPGPVAPPPTLPGTLSLASWRGRVGTLLGWRSGPPVEGSPDNEPSSELVEVDLATGAVLGVLLVVPTSVPTVEPDASGHHFLVTTRFMELYRWTGERLELLHRGVSSAAW